MNDNTELKQFLESLTKCDVSRREIKEKAQFFLDKMFEEEVIEALRYRFCECWNASDNLLVLYSGSKTKFLLCLSSDEREFIEKNWNRTDDIIEILKNRFRLKEEKCEEDEE